MRQTVAALCLDVCEECRVASIEQLVASTDVVANAATNMLIQSPLNNLHRALALCDSLRTARRSTRAARRPLLDVAFGLRTPSNFSRSCGVGLVQSTLLHSAKFWAAACFAIAGRLRECVRDLADQSIIMFCTRQPLRLATA